MKKAAWLIAILLLFGLIAYLFALKQQIPSSNPIVHLGIPTTQHQASITFPNKQTFLVDVADDDQTRTQGLSDLRVPQSMLFLFEQKVTPSFWMPNMHFPIDMIWISDSYVVGLEKNAQPENPPITFYQPDTFINAVLEVPAGVVDELMIQRGDRLDIELKKQ